MPFDKTLSAFMERSNAAVQQNLSMMDGLFNDYDRITHCIENITTHGLDASTEQFMFGIPNIQKYMTYSKEDLAKAKPPVRSLMALEGFFEVIGDIVSKIFNAIISVFQWIISMIGKVISVIFGGVSGGGSGSGNSAQEAKALTKKLEDILKTSGTVLNGELFVDMGAIENVLTTISSLGLARNGQDQIPMPIDEYKTQTPGGTSIRITLPGFDTNRHFSDIILRGASPTRQGKTVTQTIINALPAFYEDILRDWTEIRNEDKPNGNYDIKGNRPTIRFDNTVGNTSYTQHYNKLSLLERTTLNSQSTTLDSVRRHIGDNYPFAKLFTTLFSQMTSNENDDAKMAFLPAVNAEGRDITSDITREVDSIFNKYVKSVLESSVNNKNRLKDILSEDGITSKKDSIDPIDDKVSDVDMLHPSYAKTVASGTAVDDISHLGIDIGKYTSAFSRLYTLIGDPKDTNRYKFAQIKQAFETMAATQQTYRDLVENARKNNIERNKNILKYLRNTLTYAMQFDRDRNLPDGPCPTAGNYDDAALAIDVADAYTTSINVRYINKFLNVYYTTIQKLIKLTTTYTFRYETIVKTIQDTEPAHMTVGGQKVPLRSTK